MPLKYALKFYDESRQWPYERRHNSVNKSSRKKYPMVEVLKYYNIFRFSILGFVLKLNYVT